MSVFSNRYSDARNEAGAYTRAVLGLVGDRDPLQVLETTPVVVANILAGLDPESLTRREAPDKWSMVHVVRHLADSELVWGYRLRRIAAEDQPPIQGYDQDRWADGLKYQDADIGESLEELRVLRRGHVRLIRSLTPAERKRIGVHTERGQESIEHMIPLYAGHDLLHLNQLARIRKTLGLSAPA